MKHSKILFIAAAFAAFGFVACGGDDNSNPAASGGSSGGNKAWNYLNPNIPYGEFVDSRDGQVYKTVQIGTQIWMAENMDYAIEGSILNTLGGKNGYGRLYNFNQANGLYSNEKLCPVGWHLPSREEFLTLFASIGGVVNSPYTWEISDVGKLLKSAKGWGTSGNGIDSFGFSAVPARGCDSSPKNCGKDLTSQSDEYAKFWTSTPGAMGSIYVKFDESNDVSLSEYYESHYYSVRCVMD